MSASDNWRYRAQTMVCKTCIWYVEKAVAVPREVKIGRCRRHAPTIGGFPVVYPSDWCGDHRMDETKLTALVDTITEQQ